MSKLVPREPEFWRLTLLDNLDALTASGTAVINRGGGAHCPVCEASIFVGIEDPLIALSVRKFLVAIVTTPEVQEDG